MDQFRPKKKIDSRDILLPLVGLIGMGVLLIREIREILDSWFVWVIGSLGLAVIGLIIRAIWRMRSIKEEEEVQTALPIFIHSDEERAQFRAMMGVKERPPAPMKVITPDADEVPPANESPPKR